MLDVIKDCVTAVILAGGRSSRMGSCKAELLWNNWNLLEHQIEKMRKLGIEDIVVSGYSPAPQGTRFAPDIFLNKGPLCGVHAGLAAAKYPHCLVTGVDTPLVPVEVLSELIGFHIDSASRITVLAHGDKIEPTIGVYDSVLDGKCEQILMTDKTSIRQLLNLVGYSEYPFTGDERLLCDCNTPEDYRFAVGIDRLRLIKELELQYTKNDEDDI